jgi:hypothetical protein
VPEGNGPHNLVMSSVVAIRAFETPEEAHLVRIRLEAAAVHETSLPVSGMQSSLQAILRR